MAVISAHTTIYTSFAQKKSGQGGKTFAFRFFSERGTIPPSVAAIRKQKRGFVGPRKQKSGEKCGNSLEPADRLLVPSLITTDLSHLGSVCSRLGDNRQLLFGLTHATKRKPRSRHSLLEDTDTMQSDKAPIQI